MKKEFIKLAGTLCAIALVAALLLAFVNKITAPEIKKAEQKEIESAMKTIMPSATEFVEAEGNPDLKIAMKDSLVEGYFATVTVNGFGGPVKMLVGIGEDGVVRGIDILSHSETAGLGANADTDDFKNRFVRKNPELTVVTTETNNFNEVQAITGATITSNAVAEGVKLANEMIKEYKGGNK